MINSENPCFNNSVNCKGIVRAPYTGEDKEFLRDIQDSHLVEIIAEPFYRDDLGGAA